MHKQFFIVFLLSLVTVLLMSVLYSPLAWLLLLFPPYLLLGLYDMRQTEHSLQRNFPVFGRARGLMEVMRPFIRQYFIESDTDGVPINRMFRSVAYQRAKHALDSVPYGTKVDVYRSGYEWIGHSMAAISLDEIDSDPRVKVGGPDCRQPYFASLLNISAMSFGALSRNAILALNEGAKKGGFAHNTGEGGVTPYHLQHGGDLIWQIGTGYFGCRDSKGKFCDEMFKEKACDERVKMIEIKLSQGAKPGHGGILPAEKNTAEIAKIRSVPAHTQVDSPPVHSAFSNPIEMMAFIKKLRTLSEGKPIGFKLAVGQKSEFVALCKAMVETGIKPDFITVDGAEGGTGAAPLEFTNSIGMPLRDALAFVADCLMGFDLKKDIKLIASGKILSAFHLVKNLSLGADMCYSARGMMLALGCVQSLVCNTNRCPTGVATQDDKLVSGLVVSDKSERVSSFHQETVAALMDIISSAGLRSSEALNRSHVYRRVSQQQIMRFDEIFPYLKSGCLLGDAYPERFSQAMMEASAERFSSQESFALYDSGLEKITN